MSNTSSPETSLTTDTAAVDAGGGNSDAVATDNATDREWSAVTLLVERKSKRL